MQRRMIVVGALIAALTLVAGCASAVGEPQPATNGITFAIGSDDVTSWLDPVVTKWNSQHPDQPVSVLYLPEAANVQLDQLVANLQAKSPVYDVIDMDVVWTAEFAANGWIIPLKQQDFQLGDFFGSAVNTAMYQGKLFAVPDYTNADLLYYRKDILEKARVPLPAPGSTWTWSQLARLAATVASRYGLAGYAATFAQYEGLTVNFAEAVQSAGGSILNRRGTAVTLNTPQAATALNSLVLGLKQGWIPKQTLQYEELSAQEAFEPGPGHAQGQFLFLNDWPDVYATLGPDAARTYGVALLPGPDGPGSSTLGGANLAISAYSLHQETALRFIQYLTQYQQQKTMLEQGSFPPVLTSLYRDASLTARFPYLPTLYQAIKTAQPRPAITNYDQASLVISSETYQALEGNKTPRDALREMQNDLTQIIRDGLTGLPGLGPKQGPARLALARPARQPQLARHHRTPLPVRAPPDINTNSHNSTTRSPHGFQHHQVQTPWGGRPGGCRRGDHGRRLQQLEHHLAAGGERQAVDHAGHLRPRQRRRLHQDAGQRVRAREPEHRRDRQRAVVGLDGLPVPGEQQLRRRVLDTGHRRG